MDHVEKDIKKKDEKIVTIWYMLYDNSETHSNTAPRQRRSGYPNLLYLAQALCFVAYE